MLSHIKFFARTLLVPVLACSSALSSATGTLTPRSLRCEYRINPLGIDVLNPRLSWVPMAINPRSRSQSQAAYQVLVASSPQKLQADQADLWDSGKTSSDQTIHVTYSGKALASRMFCYWKVRVWDKEGRASPWSPSASWSMGLLQPSDWEATWIGDPVSPASPPSRKDLRNGAACLPADSPDAEKHVVIDLVEEQIVDAVQLHPARRFVPGPWTTFDTGYLFPMRFKIETATTADFSDVKTFADQTSADIYNPGTDAPIYRSSPLRARYVRLRVTKLRTYEAKTHGWALAEMRVFAGAQNVAEGAEVRLSDSIESDGWSARNLVDGRLASDDPYPRHPATMLRKSFQLAAAVRRAMVYVTALGLYQLQINGKRVGEQLLAPEWTQYEQRIQYQTFDVTNLLRSGENIVAATLGEGWYAGRVLTQASVPHLRPQLLLRLEIETADAGTSVMVTDGSWRFFTDGPIRFSGIYDGEVYDARKEVHGWDAPGFDDKAWKPVSSAPLGDRKLVWQRSEPIRVQKDVKPVRITAIGPREYLFDMGQNMAGWCRLKVKGEAGTTVVLRHAEELNPDHTPHFNLKGGTNIVQYSLRGDPSGEEFEPHFTYQGFRYVLATGLTTTPDQNTITGRVLHTSATEAGSFESSSTLCNRLNQNIVWTQRANMMGIPTDCPQRDERLGWMGDAQVYSGTMPFLMDVAAFFTKWLADVRAAQTSDGRFPNMTPLVSELPLFIGNPAWGDAGILCPWAVYQHYGDIRVIEENFESSRRWIEWLHSQSPDLICRISGPGDWLNGDRVYFPGYPRQGGAIPEPVFATAFFAHSTHVLSKMAAVLKRFEDARRYARLFEDIKTAFNRVFVKADGRMEGDTQAGYALALHFDLLPDGIRPKAVRYMIDGFARYNGHLSTGIQATHRLMMELTRNGYTGEAYRLLNLRTPPSWGYMVDQGATTIWERWDGWIAGRDTHPDWMGWMNSLNHVAFGAVGEWMWKNIVGINPDDERPGYKHFAIHPRPGGGLTWARGSLDSIRGRIVSDWRLDGNAFFLKVTIPVNTTSSVYLPATGPGQVTESGRPAREAPGVISMRQEGETAVLEVASGNYEFKARQVIKEKP